MDLSFPVVLRTSMSGITSDLRARLADREANEAIGLSDSSFQSIGGPIYVWNGSVDDGFDGYVVYYRESNDQVLGVDRVSPSGGFTADDRAKIQQIVSILLAAPLQVMNPITGDEQFTISRGFDYDDEDGQAVRFTTVGSVDLSGATVYLEESLNNIKIQGSVENPGEAGQAVVFELTRAQTTSLQDGLYRARVRAVMESSNEVLVARISMVVRD